MTEERDAAEQIVRIEGMRQAIASSGGVARSADGSVRVRVGPGGLLEQLEISPRAVTLGPRAVSKLIMDTLREALVALEQNVVSAVAEADAGAAGTQTLAEFRRGLSGPLTALGGGDSQTR